MSVSVRDFLKARKDRALGQVLGYAEKTFYKRLTAEERERFRDEVIGAVNSYHDSVLDLLKSESGSVRNEEVAGLLTRLEAFLNGTRSQERERERERR
jgi:ribosomal protein S17E